MHPRIDMLSDVTPAQAAEVAGGLKDVEIGDVVASSKVYWIEGGKRGLAFAPRPEVAAVSPSLVQAVRALAADGRWRARFTGAAGRPPRTIVAPLVVGEKVLAHKRSTVIALIRRSYGDAVAVDMEDFGVMRAGRSAERARVIAVRGISDLIDGKEAADEGGSQPLAAANAAAFLFEMLTRLGTINKPPPWRKWRRALAAGAAVIATATAGTWAASAVPNLFEPAAADKPAISVAAVQHLTDPT